VDDRLTLLERPNPAFPFTRLVELISRGKATTADWTQMRHMPGLALDWQQRAEEMLMRRPRTERTEFTDSSCRLQTVHLDGAQAAQTGIVRIGEGTRSPPEGLRSSARHEIAYVIAGRARIDTAEGSTIVGLET
jgi:hypothetical protein